MEFQLFNNVYKIHANESVDHDGNLIVWFFVTYGGKCVASSFIQMYGNDPVFKNVYVFPSSRGIGLASKLLETMEQYLITETGWNKCYVSIIKDGSIHKKLIEKGFEEYKIKGKEISLVKVLKKQFETII